MSGGDSTPPSTPWRTLPGFSPLPRSCAPPPPTPLRGDWGPLQRPRGPQSFPPLYRVCHFPNPGGLPFPHRVVFAPHGGSVSPPPSAVPEVDFPPSLPPALAPIRSLLALLSCVPHGDAVSGAGSSSTSSDSASDFESLLPLSPLHLSLLSPPAPPLPTSLVALRPLALAHAPRPPILPIGTKMSAIGRAGLLRVGRWRADLRPLLNGLEGPA